MNETKPTPSDAERWTSWLPNRSRLAILLLLGGGLAAVAGAGWAIFAYWNGSQGKSELLTYRLCVGHEQKLCPDDATFVRDAGQDTITKWAQKECASYKTRRIIINDAPTQDCGCYVADVRCSSE